MTRKEIELKILKIFHDTCGVLQKIDPHSHLYDDLELDSVGLLTLACEIENEFQILLPTSEEEIPSTVKELVDFIELRLNPTRYVEN